MKLVVCMELDRPGRRVGQLCGAIEKMKNVRCVCRKFGSEINDIHWVCVTSVTDLVPGIK